MNPLETLRIVSKRGEVIVECPECGYDEFSVSVRMSGRGEYIIRHDGDSGDNTELHNCLKYTMGKRVSCVNCHKKVGTLQDY